MQDLPVALAEGPADVPRDALDDDGLLTSTSLGMMDQRV